MSLSSFLCDDENDIIRQMAEQESVASERLLDQEWDMPDLDWLAETSLIPQRSCLQAGFRGSESDDNDFEYFSDGKKYDFEDLEDKFLFSRTRDYKNGLNIS